MREWGTARCCWLYFVKCCLIVFLYCIYCGHHILTHHWSWSRNWWYQEKSGPGDICTQVRNVETRTAALPWNFWKVSTKYLMLERKSCCCSKSWEHAMFRWLQFKIASEEKVWDMAGDQWQIGEFWAFSLILFCILHQQQPLPINHTLVISGLPSFNISIMYHLQTSYIHISRKYVSFFMIKSIFPAKYLRDWNTFSFMVLLDKRTKKV